MADRTIDTTIRNLDAATYRALRARAVLAGRTVGDVMNEAMRAWLAQSVPQQKTASFFDVEPEDYGEGSEHLSAQIDDILYRG